MKTQHNEDYKREAVRLVIKNDRKLRQVSEDLGINQWTLKDWVEKYGKEIQAELIGQGLKLTPEDEIKLLKKELADVQEERDILKKAIAVFSKKPKTNMFS